MFSLLNCAEFNCLLFFEVQVDNYGNKPLH